MVGADIEKRERGGVREREGGGEKERRGIWGGGVRKDNHERYRPIDRSWREREIAVDRESERERDRQTDRQTDREGR